MNIPRVNSGAHWYNTAEVVPFCSAIDNNHVVYHARTAYEDDDAANSDRLLMRLWLSMPNSRALPEGHEVLWGNIEAGAPRGGVREPVQAAG